MNKPFYHLCVKVFKLSRICHSRVMRWRLGGCKLTRRVLNYEQAANEPTAYSASILSMGYFRKLIRSEIFLGGGHDTQREDNDAMWIISAAFHFFF